MESNNEAHSVGFFHCFAMIFLTILAFAPWEAVAQHSGPPPTGSRFGDSAVRLAQLDGERRVDGFSGGQEAPPFIREKEIFGRRIAEMFQLALISRPNALNMKIQQATQKAIINWNSFSIGASESVNIAQPGASSISLNRVVGIDPSFPRSSVGTSSPHLAYSMILLRHPILLYHSTGFDSLRQPINPVRSGLARRSIPPLYRRAKPG